LKWCGKSAPRSRQRERHGKPHREQDQIGTARNPFPDSRPGRSREAMGNHRPRGMAIQPSQDGGQNPAYRPSDAFAFPCPHVEPRAASYPPRRASCGEPRSTPARDVQHGSNPGAGLAGKPAPKSYLPPRPSRTASPARNKILRPTLIISLELSWRPTRRLVGIAYSINRWGVPRAGRWGDRPSAFRARAKTRFRLFLRQNWIQVRPFEQRECCTMMPLADLTADLRRLLNSEHTHRSFAPAKALIFQ
jgi:hypothetical protein